MRERDATWRQAGHVLHCKDYQEILKIPIPTPLNKLL